MGLQFVLLALLIVTPRGNWFPGTWWLTGIAGALVVVGLALALVAGLGLGSSLTPSPIPKETGSLQTTGIYRLVRHPIYTGLLLIGLGLVVFGASLWHAVIFGGLWILLEVKARVEEGLLRDTYPDYAEYARHVGRFIPGIGLIREDGHEGGSA